jgi:Phytanoyl-CoA dioxygenase (PhyH)
MRSYARELDALPIPWVESPFFRSLLGYAELTSADTTLVANYHKFGFVKISLGMTHHQCSEVVKQAQDYHVRTAKTQESGYHYGDGARVFEAWRECPAVAALACHPEILRVLRVLYRREPRPFQTINFDRGSNQPLHSDTIHFHSLPHRWVAGVWVALEAMVIDNGSLVYVPGSHKWPVYEFPDLGIPVPAYGQQFGPNGNDGAYHEYERLLRDLVAYNATGTEILYCHAGTAIIWAANLLHGGSLVRDKNRTRHSQATHYAFAGDDLRYYTPMFSDRSAGRIAYKDLSGKDILGRHQQFLEGK